MKREELKIGTIYKIKYLQWNYTFLYDYDKKGRIGEKMNMHIITEYDEKDKSGDYKYGGNCIHDTFRNSEYYECNEEETRRMIYCIKNNTYISLPIILEKTSINNLIKITNEYITQHP